ncbi:hypothetical protein [Amycolatopsis sp. NBRC 101858]|uniref:hypothetical protein n=1 Tax=Amycolatopsis sp. NBRC 101858 TaxID=3032200 RepID=UPI0025573015|nr:hypothetical protein [Amycolatopsis sp. NBRC 101858]
MAESPRPGALTAPQDDRYGSLFLQPTYSPPARPTPDAGHGPRRGGHSTTSTRAHDPSGRRAHR